MKYLFSLISGFLAVSLALFCPKAFAENLWSHWGDGKAELAVYNFEIKRYQEMRTGTAISIFVTEDFSTTEMVKADRPSIQSVPVMKLILVQDFPTGIYDYNLMSSVFVPLRDHKLAVKGKTLKVSFSSQEWCGQVYHQLLFAKDNVQSISHSYFSGEADSSENLKLPEDTVSEDALFHWARGLAAPFLSDSQSRKAHLLRSLIEARLKHLPLESRAVILEAGRRQSIEVPAGSFSVAKRQVKSLDGGVLWTFWVEIDYPRKIIAWEKTGEMKGVLRKSKRLAYWKLNSNHQRKLLTELGL